MVHPGGRSPRQARPNGSLKQWLFTPSLVLIYNHSHPFALVRRVSLSLKKGCPKMSRRHQMTRRGSRRDFSRKSARTHKKNLAGNPMRGGIRL